MASCSASASAAHSTGASPDERDMMYVPTMHTFFRKATIIYGASGTGKSTIVRHIMHLLKGHIPTAIAFSESEEVNGMYSRIMIPRQFVYESLNPDIIRLIMERQTKAVAIYKRANDITTLEALVMRLAPGDGAHVLHDARAAFDHTTRNAGGVTPEMSEMFETRYREIMRKIIGARLERMRDLRSLRLTENEEFAIRWFSFVPDFLIVIDDCTQSIGAMKRDPNIARLLFMGRHSFVTTIMSVHADTFLDTSWRTNVGVSIFTSGTIASAYGSKSTNGISDRGAFSACASRIVDKAEPYTKMILIEQVPYLLRVEQHQPFVFVSDTVRDFARKVAKHENTDWMKGL